MNLDKIFDIPPDELLANLVTIRKEKQNLDNKEKLIATLLTASNIDCASVGIGSLREQIKFILNQATDNLSAKEVHNLINGHSIDNVRITLNRMAKKGEIKITAPPNKLYYI